MAYTTVNYADVESKAGLYFLRDELDCENLGISVIDVEDGREGPAHDHADGDQEEVYVLTEGAARLTVDDEELRLEPGDSVRVAPEASRQLTVEGDSQLVIVGAPRSAPVHRLVQERRRGALAFERDHEVRPFDRADHVDHPADCVESLVDCLGPDLRVVVVGAAREDRPLPDAGYLPEPPHHRSAAT